MKNISLLIAVLFAGTVYAQNVGVGTASPDASAMLDVASANKGLLVPRVALTATNNSSPVTSPQTSLLVYNMATAGSGSYAVKPGYYYWDDSVWVKLVAPNDIGNNAWGTKGNAGTDTAINFIGTTDAANLVFKVNGKRVGLLEDTTITNNGSIAWGIDALKENQTGYSNVAIGLRALSRNNSGSYNIALGHNSMTLSPTGDLNIALGLNTLQRNDGGVENTAIGFAALPRNTSGYRNIAIGGSTLRFNTTGGLNTAIGYRTMENNTTGAQNIAIGNSALAGSTEVRNSIAIGDSSLYNNGTLIGQNIGIGTGALKANTFGQNNLALGFQSLYTISGTNNVALGYRAAYAKTVGIDNVYIGSNSGIGDVFGTNNLSIGANAGFGLGNLVNATSIGSSSYVSQSNTMVLGSINGVNGAIANTNVGIGTPAPNPTALLHVNTGSDLNNGVLVTGSQHITAAIPDLGSGSRMMFYPGKAAFRAGFIEGAQWDNVNTGQYSSALGYNNLASGLGSSAFGGSNRAEGGLAFAAGNSNIVKGYASTVVGVYNDSILTVPQTSGTFSNTPLFIIGNGFSNANRSNVMVVYKSGIDLNGFTRLGDSTVATAYSPRIKMKKFTGVSSGTQGTWVNIAHGLTQSKILSVSIIMSVPAFVNVPPSYTFHAGYEYQYQVAPTNIVVINTAANSANILSKNFTILITYEE